MRKRELAESRVASSWFTITHIFVVSYIISYLILPIVKYFDPEWVMIPTLFDPTIIPTTVFWATIGLLVFLLGYRMNFRKALKLKYISSISLRRGRLWTMWIATVIATILMTVKLLYDFGLDELLYHREVVFNGLGITLYLYLTLVTYSAVFSLLLFKFGRSTAIIVVEAILLLTTSFGARGLLVCYLLAVALLVSQRPGRRSILALLKSTFKYAVIGLLVILSFGLVLIRSSEDLAASAARRAIEGTFEEGEMFSLVYAHYSGHLLNGQTIWDTRYIFLPRQILPYLPRQIVPDKPEIYGSAVLQRDVELMSVYGKTNLSSASFGLLSELYANFGHLGMILGMYCWGWFYAFVERIRTTPADSVGLFVYLTLYIYQFWPFRHGFIGLVQILVVPVLVAPILLKLAYVKRAHKFPVEHLEQYSLDHGS